MNSRRQNTLATFQRIQSWLADRPELTGVKAGVRSTKPAGSTSPATSTTPASTTAPATSIGEQSILLDAAVSDAEAEASKHDGLNRSILGLGAETKTFRTQLISDQMVHVATIARTAIPDVVRMTEAFRVPRVTRKTGALLAAAESMAKASEQYKDKLVASGLSADFPEQLRAAAAALREAVDARGTSVADRVGASTAFHEALVRGRKAVDTMTVLIKRQFKGDRATIDSWMQLRRIPLVGVRNTGAILPAPVTAAATAPEQQTRAA